MEKSAISKWPGNNLTHFNVFLPLYLQKQKETWQKKKQQQQLK